MKRAFKLIALVVSGFIGLYILSSSILYWTGYRIYRVPTLAMEPTIQQGERVIGRLSEDYRLHVNRFDLALFQSSKIPGQIFVKRVIGLPGEHVTVGAEGIRINGEELALPEAVDRSGLELKPCDLLVPSDSFFILGDFTPSSLDSRYIGPIPRSDILGYLVFRK